MNEFILPNNLPLLSKYIQNIPVFDDTFYSLPINKKRIYELCINGGNNSVYCGTIHDEPISCVIRISKDVFTEEDQTIHKEEPKDTEHEPKDTEHEDTEKIHINEFIKDCKVALYMSNKNLSPRLYSIYQNPMGFTTMISERYQTSLSDFIVKTKTHKLLKKTITQKLVELTTDIVKNNILLYDYKFANLVLNCSEGDDDIIIKAIDFDSMFIDVNITRMKLFRDVKKIYKLTSAKIKQYYVVIMMMFLSNLSSNSYYEFIHKRYIPYHNEIATWIREEQIKYELSDDIFCYILADMYKRHKGIFMTYYKFVSVTKEQERIQQFIHNIQQFIRNAST